MNFQRVETIKHKKDDLSVKWYKTPREFSHHILKHVLLGKYEMWDTVIGSDIINTFATELKGLNCPFKLSECFNCSKERVYKCHSIIKKSKLGELYRDTLWSILKIDWKKPRHTHHQNTIKACSQMYFLGDNWIFIVVTAKSDYYISAAYFPLPDEPKSVEFWKALRKDNKLKEHYYLKWTRISIENRKDDGRIDSLQWCTRENWEVDDEY